MKTLYEKGTSGNPVGRPVGSKTKSTESIRAKISDFINHNLETIQRDYDQMRPQDRLNFIEKLLKYSIPSLQAMDLIQHTKQEVASLPDEQLNELAEKILQSN